MAKDLTPEHLKCTVGASCPSVHELEDGRLLIVGLQLPTFEAQQLGAKLNPLEAAIVIERGLLDEVLKCQASAAETGAGSAPTAFQSIDTAEAFATKLTNEIMELYHTGFFDKEGVFLCADIAFREATGACRPMTGILGRLTEEQRAAAFAYDGPEFLGSERSGQNDEGCKPDERTADSAEAYTGPHGDHLRKRALEHAESPLARDLLMAAGWVDAMNYELQQMQRRIEEARSADERTAEQRDDSLTSKTLHWPHSEPVAVEETSPATSAGQNG